MAVNGSPPVFKNTTLDRKTGSWRERSQTPIFVKEPDTISICMIACPIHQNIRRWVALLKDKKNNEAVEELLKMNPLPASVSRVCPKFCEMGCQYLRKGFDWPIAVSVIEKFLGDLAIEKGINLPLPEISKKGKMAIIGAGPAGLTFAYLLRHQGYAVTVFEKEEKLGGLLRYGIPEDRLPKDILDKELALHFSGIEFQMKTGINQSNFPELKEEFQKIFFAPGLNESRKLNIMGESFPEVIPGLQFLKSVMSGSKIYPLDRNLEEAVVIGGGNTAMDAARVAKLSGIKNVRIFHRRNKIRAKPEEVETIRSLGVEIRLSTTLKRVWRADLRSPKLNLLIENNLTGQIYVAQANLVVVAVGQEKTALWSESGLAGDNIFLGGDLLLGPKTVAHAIGSAQKNWKMSTKITASNINFAYFKPELKKEEITEEASRCFSCGICRECNNCLNFCPEPAVKKTDDQQSPYQIDYDFCKGCGICLKECPRGVIKWKQEK